MIRRERRCWRNVSTSQPNAAVFHISHSESTRVLVDLLRPSDSAPDANFVLTGNGGIVEIQATAEQVPFKPDQFDTMLKLAMAATENLFALQQSTVDAALAARDAAAA